MALKPPVEVPQGPIRLNTDSQKLEFFAQDQWWEMATTESAPLGGRGLWGGGQTAQYSYQNTIEYVTIATLGDAIDFGDLTNQRATYGSCASTTRGLFSGGKQTPSGNPQVENNTIDYVTIATQGNGTDFGDIVGDDKNHSIYGDHGCVGSQTRGLFAGGNGRRNTISYVTITSTGNTQDFGDLVTAIEEPFGLSNPTRGIFGGDSPTALNLMEYVTIASTGNAKDFGDSTITRNTASGCSNGVRGFVAGAFNSPVYSNNIDFITVATTGNAQDWGDLTTKRMTDTASNKTRAVVKGAVYPHSAYGDNPQLDVYSLTTQGNATDFGDSSAAAGFSGGLSNAHGGL